MLLLLCVFTLSNGAVLAQSDSEPAQPDVGTYSADARTARIAALKELYKIKLDDKEKASVSARCTGAQEGLRNIAKRLEEVKSDREKTYTSTIDTLIRLKSALLAKHIDSSGIDLLIVSYQQSKALFDTSVLAYEVSIEDATLLDCAKSPEDFRAALEGVRAARKPVVNASAQIKEITKSNLKTTFDSIISRLQTEKGSGGE